MNTFDDFVSVKRNHFAGWQWAKNVISW
jgi:hypothetical protein